MAYLCLASCAVVDCFRLVILAKMRCSVGLATYIDGIIRRANRALGIYLRSLQTSRAITGRRFEPAPLVTAFNAHFRSILEFGSVIWSGAAKSHITRLDRVQHKFLIWLAVNSNRPSDSLDYSHLLSHFRVPRISSRLAQHDLVFLHGVLNDRFDSSDIKGMIGLAVPARVTRTRPILHDILSLLTPSITGYLPVDGQ